MDRTRFVLRLLLLVVSTLHVVWAQTPPVSSAAVAASGPIPGSVSAWPAADSITPGTTLLVETDRYSGTPYECKLQRVDNQGITCRGPHHRAVTYERAMVRSLRIRTQHLRNAYIGFVVAAAAFSAGGLACAFAGGPVGCAVLLAAGLGSGLVAAILHGIHDLHGPGEPTPIYLAPEPVAPAT